MDGTRDQLSGGGAPGTSPPPATLVCVDHVAVTVSDVDTATEFYRRLFGAESIFEFAPDGPVAVRSLRVGGGVVMNLHQACNGVDLVAAVPTPGALDVCFRFRGAIEEAQRLLERHGVRVIAGPAPRTTADGRPGQSVYFRDPDGNLIELMAEDR